MRSRDGDDQEYVVSVDLSICVNVKKGGYRPKSAFLLTSCLNQFNVEGKIVLDLGCGETGIIAHYALARGAKKVIGVDIDPSAIAHANRASLASCKIMWVVSDLFGNLGKRKLDMIITNPPQMPMSDVDRTRLLDWHDTSGPTGRELILKTLEEGRSFLNPHGEIFLLVFDFLGVKKSFNSSPSLFEIAESLGYSCEVLENYSRMVRLGGQTAKNLAWINEVYPRYEFRRRGGNISYGVSVVRLKIQ